MTRYDSHHQSHERRLGRCRQRFARGAMLRCTAVGILALVSLALALSANPHETRAAGTVTTCDEASLDAAIAEGGVVTFACSGTITVTSTKVVSSGTKLVVDGTGHDVIIAGGGAVEIFVIRPGASLEITHLTLADGFAGVYPGVGGAVFVTGTLVARDVVFRDNQALGGVGIGGGAGGAIWGATGGRLSIEGCTFEMNRASGGGGGLYTQAGTSTAIKHTVFRQNSAASGAAIHNFGGNLSIGNSTFQDNVATTAPGILGRGGAIRNAFGGAAEINGSTFSGNSASLAGGAIINEGSSPFWSESVLVVGSSTFNNNSVVGSMPGMPGGGGAVDNLGSFTVYNSTFARNSVPSVDAPEGRGSGGAIRNATEQATLLVTNTTFSDNSAFQGSGIHNTGQAILANVIVANHVRGDCWSNSPGAITDGGGNLVEDGSCGLPAGGDPELGPLQDNGGPTMTMAIPRRSPAFRAGVSAICRADAPDGAGGVDQRGVPRRACAAGAYEPDGRDVVSYLHSPPRD